MKFAKLFSRARSATPASSPAIAGVYLRRGMVYMHPLVKTTEGLSIFAEPVLAAEAANSCAATQLLALLSVRRGVIPHPTSWQGLTDPLIKAAGARSFNEFAKATKYVEAQMEGDTVSLVPTRNGGRSEGFVHLTDRAMTCPPKAEQLRPALEAAFAVCA